MRRLVAAGLSVLAVACGETSADIPQDVAPAAEAGGSDASHVDGHGGDDIRTDSEEDVPTVDTGGEVTTEDTLGGDTVGADTFGGDTLGADTADVPWECTPLPPLPVGLGGPAASVAPLPGALLRPDEVVVVRFSTYMHPGSLGLAGDLAEGTVVWKPPYQVALIQPPAGGWTAGGTLRVEGADRGCTVMAPLNVSYPGVSAPRPTLTLKLRFILTADDDGSRPVPLTDAIEALWLQEVREVYERAAMEFSLVDDGASHVVVHDTGLNELWAGSPPEVLQKAVALVAPYPSTVNVIFSWGPLPVPAQGGFSSPSLPFVSITSFEDTLICGDLSRDVLPHEMGHHFGLPHTHQAEFPTVAAAAASYDGSFLPWDDGFAETPALPHIGGMLCDPPESLVLGGIERATWPGNLMNYDWTPHGALSWEQEGVVRQSAAIRYGIDLRALVSPPADSFYEAEALGAGIAGWGSQGGMGAFFGVWSGDAQAIWAGSPGSHAMLPLEVSEAGTYRLFGGFTLGPDFGIHRIAFGGTQGAAINLYSPMVRHSALLDLGAYELEAGSNELTFTTLGSEASSAGMLLGVDYLLLRREE